MQSRQRPPVVPLFWLLLVVVAANIIELLEPVHGFFGSGCCCCNKRQRHTTTAPLVIQRADNNPSLWSTQQHDFSTSRRTGSAAASTTTSRCRILLVAPLHHSSSSANRRKSSSSSSSSSAQRDHDDDPNDNRAAASVSSPSDSRRSTTTTTTIRLNKVFKSTHSRREADRLILDGRVQVNGIVSYGCMVTPFLDTVQLDNVTVVGWEQMNNAVVLLPVSSSSSSSSNQNRLDKSSSSVGKASSLTSSSFEYIKYWKPRGVTCTTDRRVADNIIDHLIQINGYRPRHRVYPVGRLDKDTTGLILLTSDGRLPNASLRYRHHQPKVYNVIVDRPVTARDVQTLRDGVQISTIAQRDGRRRTPLTALTRPCEIVQDTPYRLSITLTEGRNRQIRKMFAALHYTVVALHRQSFGDITLRGLHQPGDWCRLTESELTWVHQSLLLVEE